MPFNRFEFKQLPVSPWRNGGGETREIVSLPLGNADFDWRASIATIAQAGRFLPSAASIVRSHCWKATACIYTAPVRSIIV
ncbi:Various environmental stresses-induced protein [Serratia odorifera]|uniref:Various environmental stresses-induced protein n=1 Tax=Serratia odorifera TaxID=618 RepID=A0A3S4HST2_SEROD|nr:Various environmental stresses-induced protein [Serratia odorifera]